MDFEDGLVIPSFVDLGYTNPRIFKLAAWFTVMLICKPWVYKSKKS